MIEAVTSETDGSVIATPPTKFKFVKTPIPVSKLGKQHGACIDGYQLQDRMFTITLKEYGGALHVDEWMLTSCAAMGLSRFNGIYSWPAESVPDFLEFLSTLQHRGGWIPKKFYFCVKVSNQWEEAFTTALKEKARLIDTFINKAHNSHGELGLYTLEFPK